VWRLPGVHDVDLHALTDQGEQRGKGLIEGHEPVSACLLPQPGGFEGSH
jgi:hypothetical protein